MKGMKKSRVFICAALLLAMLLPAVMAHAEGESKFIELKIVKAVNATADQWSGTEEDRATFIFAAYLDLLNENSELLTETLTEALVYDKIYFIRKDATVGFIAMGNKAYITLYYATEDTKCLYVLVEDSNPSSSGETIMKVMKGTGGISDSYKVDTKLVFEMMKIASES